MTTNCIYYLLLLSDHSIKNGSTWKEYARNRVSTN